MKKIINKTFNEERVDKFLVFELKISRNKVLSLIKDLKVKINDEWVQKPGQLLFLDDEVTIYNIKTINIMKPIKMKLDIIYEDNNYLIVNKPSGLLVHSSSFNEENTLAAGIKHYFQSKNIQFPDDDYRWGICHRLDKDTSGLLIIAKNLKVQEIFMELIKNKSVKREYIAIINKRLETNKIKIDVPIKRNKKGKLKMIPSNDFDAKDAITFVEKVIDYDNFSLIRCILETGRTHQIRVHLKYLKRPIVNDPLYGNNKIYNKYGQYLYASKIEFEDPFTKEWKSFKAHLPKEFNDFIKENT
ncbi:MAG: RluA family pseudouridine synthase [Mycoplasmoidaceae bacterium]